MDKNSEALGGREALDSADDLQESSLDWLLDDDLADPEERLFTIDQSAQVNTGLTDYEKEVARRPLTRGSAGADDLESYIDEEIVISSETHNSDIYAPSAAPASTSNTRVSGATADPMAIDYSRDSGSHLSGMEAALADGLDILGLVDDDDMGQRDLVLKRVKASDIAAETPAVPQAITSGVPLLRLVTPEKPLLVANDAATGSFTDQSGSAAEAQSLDDSIDRLGDELMLSEFTDPATSTDASDEQWLLEDDNFDDILAGFGELNIGDAVEESNTAAEDLLDTSLEDGLDIFAEDIFGKEISGDTIESSTGKWLQDEEDFGEFLSEFGQMENSETPAVEIANVVAAPLEEDEPLEEGVPLEGLNVFAEQFDSLESSSGLEVPKIVPEPEQDYLADNLEPLAVQAASEQIEKPELELEPVLEIEPELEMEPELEIEPELELEPVLEIEPELEMELEAVAEDQFSYIPTNIRFSHASPGGGEIFADFLDAFIEEGSSEIEKLEDAIAAWEHEVTSDAAYAVVSRTLHTIKGIAKGVGLHFYGTLIHNFETLLGTLPRPAGGAEGDYFRRVNAWLDACVRGLDQIQDTRADISHELPQLAGPEAAVAPAVSEPEVQAVVEAVQDEQLPSPVPVLDRVDELARQSSNKKIADDGARVLAAQQSVRITSEKLDHLLNLSNQAQQLTVRTGQSVTRGKRTSIEMHNRLASVRAHIAGIADRALRSVAAHGVQPGAPMDALEMDQYSELQEAANILREGVEDLADLVDFATRQNAQIEALLKQQTKVISSIGSAIRNARVVPVSRLIPGLRRLVRTISLDLNKTVSFQVLNELGTLDRDDYARCQTILDHMVRNALDHGIETSDERVAAGKPIDGLVTIDIRKAGADSIITLTDDGRGIDPARMRESAISKGLEVDVAALTDAEAIRLVFHKGFSTANSISQISGRGVGMDIVLSELQEMGGDIQIDSVPGRGTSFHIRVPSSVTVNGALMVSAGEQSYAIPLGGLIAVEQVPVEDFFAAIKSNTSITVSGMECEPAYLATLCNTGHALEANTWRSSVPVIIAGSVQRYMAIAIDHVEEALELVIRSLGPQFSSVPGVAGAATTAAGEAIVALDLNLLVASVGANDQSSVQIDATRDRPLLVMVVDDSRTQRMVATSQLETLGVETLTAENGGVAIELLNAADRLPDIILMDVEMPVKDGIQALREIRKSVRYGHLPVIMITSRTGLKHRAMAQAAGCNGYMGKPFNFRMLVGQINELTGHCLQLV